MIVARPTSSSCIIVVDAPLAASTRTRLEALDPRVQVTDGLSPETQAVAEVVYLGKGKLDPAAAPRLRWVQYNSAGIGGLLASPVARAAVPVASASGAYSTSVAEMAVALLLSLQRRLPACHELQRRRCWRGEVQTIRGDASRGRTLGILGYGSIGRELARLAQALGMRVLACKRQPHVRRDSHFCLPGTGDPEGTIPAAWFGIDGLEDMLAQSDVLAVTLPGGSRTHQQLGAPQLAALPPHALVISVGRGSVLDEAALVEALRAGRLAGAGLDVFAEEPLPPASPLWSLPNVIITPHMGSDTRGQAVLAGEVLVENVRRYLAGEPLLNLVDFTLGY